MPAHSTCEKCTTLVDKVYCAEHAPQTCNICKRTVDQLYCEDCAENEFGGDDTPGEPDEDDVIELLVDMAISDEVGDLAAAIRRGDQSEAEYLLDKIAGQVPGWADRVSIGRYSPVARAA